ncbi:sulfite exporter TauE/SafE family protein [Legionella sp.]|uniref:sulfite exporter TauE/SafE family protein n=1 Tax=Legionella sp. TaxID=459 RepID=UPI003C967FB1
MTIIFLHGIIYALIGIFAGLMAGILGIGGGLIVVPGLLFVFQQIQVFPEDIFMQVAAGTSMAIMIITSQASLKAHYKYGDILWSVYDKLWPGIIIGTISGAVIAQWISTYWLQIIFAIFLFCVAIKMLMDAKISHSAQFPQNWINRFISFLIGFKSGLLGVGGGILIIPYLSHCGVAARKIAGVSNLCTLTVALTGSIIFMITGYHETTTIPYMTGYIYWPAVLLVALFSCIAAPIGAQLNYKLPVAQLKYGFIVLLILTALKLLF